MPDVIELPAPHRDPRAQERYLRERAELAANSTIVARMVDRYPDADHIKTVMGIR